MQERIVELLNQISIEEVTVDLLHLNDELNNLFMRFDRYQRMAVGSVSQSSTVRNIIIKKIAQEIV